MAAGDPVRFIETRAWPMRLMTGALPRPPAPCPAGQAGDRRPSTGPARRHVYRRSVSRASMVFTAWQAVHRPGFHARSTVRASRRRARPGGLRPAPGRAEAGPEPHGVPRLRSGRGRRWGLCAVRSMPFARAAAAIARRDREEAAGSARLAWAHLNYVVSPLGHAPNVTECAVPPAAGLLRRSLGQDAIAAITASARRRKRACRTGRPMFGPGPGRRAVRGSGRR